MTVKNCRVLGHSRYSGADDFDGVLLVLTGQKDNNDPDFTELFKDVPKPWAEALEAIGKRLKIKAKPGDLIAYDFSPELRLVALMTESGRASFSLLGDCKQALDKLCENGAKKLLVDLRHAPNSVSVADAASSALTAKNFKFAKYSTKKDKDPESCTIDLLVEDASLDNIQQAARHAETVAESTNLVRNLTMRSANDLNPGNYIAEVRELAKEWGVNCTVMDIPTLKEKKAGAFLAVAQASSAKDAGIVRLEYPGKGSKRHLCFVGKGVTFDTGGNNLKPAAGMFGMEGDMSGSAVSLAMFKLAVAEEWDEKVTCFLAISDNLIGEKAYKPNDVVTAASGKTIEIVHTDAEGRMLLADTLFFASEEKPNLMVDFATLTGACMGAIGTAYAGAFTNRNEYHQSIIEAGQESGERVWPFPLDDDFGDCLKSDVADIKQCRLKGGADHIEAAWFLKEFVNKDVPWIHIDLSASNNGGGLAHVGTDVTGFGVKLTASLVRKIR